MEQVVEQIEMDIMAVLMSHLRHDRINCDEALQILFEVSTKIEKLRMNISAGTN